MIIINADDVGRCREETDIAVELFRERLITSGTVMMFMEDSERAAGLAQEHGLSAGLHLNLSQPYNGRVPAGLAAVAHDRVVRFMTSSKYAVLVYHPGLRSAFRDVYQSQAEEYSRLFGHLPRHVDGHQHRHLCANVLCGDVIPAGLSVRRSFSFFRGDKGWLNRRYRSWVDGRLGRRHRLANYFFSLAQCLKKQTLPMVFELARSQRVELMVHPVHAEESGYLRSEEFTAVRNNLELGNYDMI